MDLTSYETSGWLIQINQNAQRMKKEGFLNKVYSTSDEENSHQSTSPVGVDPVLLVSPYSHTLQLARNQVKKKIRTFFANLMVLLLGTLFLAMLAASIIVITGEFAKIEAFVIFLIALSHITRMQVKHICRARKQAYLTTPQIGKNTPIVPKDEDMEYLKLLKQDTSTYLHNLVARDLEKTF